MRANRSAAVHAMPGGKGMKLRLAVELDVLRGVDQVEAEDPAPDRRGEQPGQGRARIAGGGGPGAHRRGGQGEAEKGVGVGGEALGERVAENDDAGDRTEHEAEKIELGAAEDKSGEGDDAEHQGHAAGAELGAALGAGIEGIVVPIGPAVEGHRGRAGRDEAPENPEDRPQIGHAARRDEHGRKRKRQRENRMGKLDQLQRSENVPEQAGPGLAREARSWRRRRAYSELPENLAQTHPVSQAGRGFTSNFRGP